MRRVLPILALLALAACGPAQSNEATSAPGGGSRPAKPAQTKPAAPKPASKRAASKRAVSKPPARATSKPVANGDPFGRAMAWARKSAYAVSQGGRTYAEGLIRQAPKTFGGVQKEVQGFGKRVMANGALKDLDEKRRYIAELWRLRASLDLMALLEPHTLETITGIDAQTLAGLSRTLQGAAKTLGLTTAQTRPAATATKSPPKG